ncbi:FkbM family methyltransferase [Nocardioides psychrotolerans]|uniref:FkbM family methyltransferase n=1 Tax=Nocardioides psychrotolerans TaxID=1005945 RepID=UPI000B84161F|nr:FkbM family methyltransferase [Nocardioides psychrotolerans]
MQFDEIAIAHHVLGKRAGFMVDVGAHRGYAHTPFVEDGWSVLAVEPDPANRRYLEDAPHPRVDIIPKAITATDGETLTLYTSEVSSGISSLAAFHPSHTPGPQVETARLDTLVAGRRVDFLKVDTEGFDLPVLQTFDWSQKPDVVVCEFEDHKTVPLGYTYRDLGDFLVGHGYTVLMSEWNPIVEYGQAHKWRRLVPYPADLVTEDGWGNFIAVRSPDAAAKAMRAGRVAAVRLRVRGAVDKARGK